MSLIESERKYAKRAVLKDGALVDPFPVSHPLSGKWYLALFSHIPVAYVECNEYTKDCQRRWKAGSLTNLHFAYGEMPAEALYMLYEGVKERAQMEREHYSSVSFSLFEPMTTEEAPQCK